MMAIDRKTVREARLRLLVRGGLVDVGGRQQAWRRKLLERAPRAHDEAVTARSASCLMKLSKREAQTPGGTKARLRSQRDNRCGPHFFGRHDTHSK